MEELDDLNRLLQWLIRKDAENWVAIRNGNLHALGLRLYLMLLVCVWGIFVVVLLSSQPAQLVPTRELVEQISTASQFCEQLRLLGNGSLECLKVKPEYEWMFNGT